MRLWSLSPARDGDALTPALCCRSTALDWMGENPVRTAGKDEQASSVTRAGGGDRQRPRKPDRRCFKPRPLLRAECAGFASGCRSDFLERLALLSRRLAGLLSGYLPTDTRPQARAKLGITEISNFGDTCKRIVRSDKNLS